MLVRRTGINTGCMDTIKVTQWPRGFNIRIAKQHFFVCGFTSYAVSVIVQVLQGGFGQILIRFSGRDEDMILDACGFFFPEVIADVFKILPQPAVTAGFQQIAAYRHGFHPAGKHRNDIKTIYPGGKRYSKLSVEVVLKFPCQVDTDRMKRPSAHVLHAFFFIENLTGY